MTALRLPHPSTWPSATPDPCATRLSLANMFGLPMGMACGANIGVSDVVSNLVPAMLGNALGTAILVGGMTRVSIFSSSGPPKPEGDHSKSN